MFAMPATQRADSAQQRAVISLQYVVKKSNWDLKVLKYSWFIEIVSD